MTEKLLITPLKIDFPSAYGTDTIYPVLIELGHRKILVDCGYPAFGPLLEDALKQIGANLAVITDIIITHHDLDHVGALAEIYEANPGIRIHASEQEKLFVEGLAKAPRLVQAEALFDTLPDDQKPGAIAFQSLLENIRPAPVHQLLSEETDNFGGIKVIATPGHTPGHVSLYIPNQKTLIAGDAVVYENGILDIANPGFTLDLRQAIASVCKIAAFDITRLICFHGGTVENPQPLFSELVERYQQPQS
ncbi:MBL fold metallo-hydrolase [Dyadobacter crusticola]|uniref:MBL fold metallo-hydrolase n=1 Tax=Dyadobacter crusticola TaxID=292407 RepID=UPI000A074F4F|nr:MBL fold metallo-hydrolase [Dyadobacter crusticola]